MDPDLNTFPATASPQDGREDMDVGIIGLGLLGSAFASRLIQNGFRVTGFDVDGEQRQHFAALGGSIVTEASAVAARCHRILLVLPDDNISAQVLTEAGPWLQEGSIVLDATTGAPPAAEAAASWLAQRGIHYLDATVSGSSEQVTRGEAVYFVGGESAALARCGDIFKALGGQLFPTGPAGSGAKMKLITNLVLGLNRAALAEGLTFARALGVDPETALTGLRASLGYSRIMDSKGEKMISGDFTPAARLSQHLKDVRLMMEATPLALPMSQAHCALLEKAVAMGYGHLDNSAIIRAIGEVTL